MRPEESINKIEALLTKQKRASEYLSLLTDILKSAVDLVVCDGFVGNIILKYTESFFEIFREKLKKKAKL